MKGAQCSELVKSSVPSIRFVWKSKDFLVTREQKLGATGRRALLEHSLAYPLICFNKLNPYPFRNLKKSTPFGEEPPHIGYLREYSPPLGGLGWLWGKAPVKGLVTETERCLIAHLMGVCLRKHSLSRFHSIMMHTLMLSNEIVPLLQTVHPSSMFHLSGR